MINKILFAYLFIIQAAFGGLPPTTSRISSDSSNITTFNFKFPNFTGTHTGSAVSLGVNSIAGGGTGQGTKAAAFDALSPMSASGDVIYGGTSGTGTRLAKGSDTQVLTLVSGLPAWVAPSSSPRNQIVVDTGNGYGSTNTKIRRYSNVVKNLGSAITYADSATLGGTFTINTTGVYSATACDSATSGACQMGITVNSVVGTSPNALSYANGKRAYANPSGQNCISVDLNLSAGDVVRMQGDTTPLISDDNAIFSIVQVAN